jgi:acetyl esterase/lipase
MRKAYWLIVITASSLLLFSGCTSTNNGRTHTIHQNASPEGGLPPNGMFAGLPPDMMFDNSKITRKYLDIAYATQSPAQKLDIYLPEKGDGPFPVIIFIHGGGFQFGDKGDNQVKPYIRGLEKGYAIVSVNYRMSGEAIFPAAVLDVKASIRFLRAHAAEYKLDGGRFAAAGGSSGANLVCMLCTTGNIPIFDDPSLGNADIPSMVQAGVSWYAPLDFSKLDEQLNANGFGPGTHGDANSFESRYLGDQLSKLPADKVQAANPINYVNPDMPPVFLQAGRNDHQVPYQQSQILADKIAAIAGKSKVQFEIIENADHIDPLFETDANMAKVFDFIDKALSK